MSSCPRDRSPEDACETLSVERSEVRCRLFPPRKVKTLAYFEADCIFVLVFVMLFLFPRSGGGMRVETQRIRNRGRGRDDPLPGLVWAVRGSAGSTPAPPHPTRPRPADRTGPVAVRGPRAPRGGHDFPSFLSS